MVVAFVRNSCHHAYWDYGSFTERPGQYFAWMIPSTNIRWEKRISGTQDALSMSAALTFVTFHLSASTWRVMGRFGRASCKSVRYEFRHPLICMRSSTLQNFHSRACKEHPAARVHLIKSSPPIAISKVKAQLPFRSMHCM